MPFVNCKHSPALSVFSSHRKETRKRTVAETSLIFTKCWRQRLLAKTLNKHYRNKALYTSTSPCAEWSFLIQLSGREAKLRIPTTYADIAHYCSSHTPAVSDILQFFTRNRTRRWGLYTTAHVLCSKSVVYSVWSHYPGVIEEEMESVPAVPGLLYFVSDQLSLCGSTAAQHSVISAFLWHPIS